MKFAQYLEQTQTPEWKKAYIDYRGLKKRITAIRREREGLADSGVTSGSGEDPLLPASDHNQGNSDSPASDPAADGSPERDSEPGSEQDVVEAREPDHGPVERRLIAKADSIVEDDDGDSAMIRSSTSSQHAPEPAPAPTASAYATGVPATTSASARPAPVRTSTLRSLAERIPRPSFRFGRVATSPAIPSELPTTTESPEYARSPPQTFMGWAEAPGALTPSNGLMVPVPLRILMPTLTAVQMRFFDKLDSELEKVESFYLDREKEARARAAALKDQLQELKDHRRLFYEAHPPSHTAWAWTSFLPPALQPTTRTEVHIQADVDRARPNAHHASASTAAARATHTGGSVSLSGSTLRPKTVGARRGARAKVASRAGAAGGAAKTPAQRRSILSMPVSFLPEEWTHRKEETAESNAAPGGPASGSRAGSARRAARRSVVEAKGKQREQIRLDPDEYSHAKKKLKKAVLEHYRGLEVLGDYRILNLTGFRKALKKFEKVARIPAQAAYMKEKVDPSAFASGDTVNALLKETEEIFAARFSRGDKKRAKARLRNNGRINRAHHFSTFRSGVMLGLSLPPLVDGIVKSFQADTRAAITGWDGLLFIYGILLVPTLFSYLVGLNLIVWAISRVNYVFIFELDVRSRLDHYQYTEVPLLMLTTLIYAFYFSFARIGASSIDPTTWPLIWLLFVASVMFNPLPVFRRAARWWLFKNIGRLLTSGTRRVEFADFWMGDQFCSLIFTLSNLYFIGCVYSGGTGGIGAETVKPGRFAFDHTWSTCASSTGNHKWFIPFILSSIPLLVRFVQSIKRYVDSKLVTHLINGGKYGAGIIYYGTYYGWRHSGGNAGGVHFAIWCLFGTVYALYASSWDFLMDWSVLKPHANFPLLRSELLYTDHIPLYYFAIISNLMIRFIWVLYIPKSGPNFFLRTFIAGFLEMLRRWQWNMYRLENEHLGNMDQYRVTREVPLPYSLDDLKHDSDGEEDQDEDAVSKRSWRSGGRSRHAPSSKESDNEA